MGLLVVLLLVLWTGGRVWADVTFGGADEGTSGANLVTEWGYTVTIPSGTNSVLYVGVCTANGLLGEMSITVDGLAMTLVEELIVTGDAGLYLFRRLLPPTGARTITVLTTNGRRQASGAIIVHDVLQATPNDAAVEAFDVAATSISVNATTTTGEMLLDVGCKRSSTETITMGAQSGRTERWNIASTGASPSTNISAGGSTRTGTGSLAMDWSHVTTPRGIGVIAMNVNAAAAAAPGRLSPGFKLLQ